MVGRRFPHTFSQMNLTRKSITRFIFGALLPVPLFVGIYYFSYFYTSYNGFDHKTNTYIIDGDYIGIERQHLRSDAIVFLVVGYFMMGIPSLVYSFLLERHRSSLNFTRRTYVGWGVVMGGICGLVAVYLPFPLTGGIHDSLLVVGISSGVGGIIPFFLAKILPSRTMKQERENKLRID